MFNTAQEHRSAPEADPASANKVIEDLLVCLSEETGGIRHSLRFDVKGAAARKSRLLYDLGRTDTALAKHISRDALLRLKTALANNALQLRAHLSAVQEITELMIGVVKREEADGTYSKTSAASRNA